MAASDGIQCQESDQTSKQNLIDDLKRNAVLDERTFDDLSQQFESFRERSTQALLAVLPRLLYLFPCTELKCSHARKQLKFLERFCVRLLLKLDQNITAKVAD